ncbi:hypothetical protein INT44_002666 [Umbelopsis vinacea]|uniref:Uncharacterized protein n=1 Tax=Umbelopsis vinacea TaxID=44442 RepID=A0A8H7PG22_9FUNG|nr:hypothetical protein INT44_002666 [Umbelopsis vinacea]
MKFTAATSVALVALMTAVQAQNTCTCDPSDYSCLADCGMYLTITPIAFFFICTRLTPRLFQQSRTPIAASLTAQITLATSKNCIQNNWPGQTSSASTDASTSTEASTSTDASSSMATATSSESTATQSLLATASNSVPTAASALATASSQFLSASSSLKSVMTSGLASASKSLQSAASSATAPPSASSTHSGADDLQIQKAAVAAIALVAAAAVYF